MRWCCWIGAGKLILAAVCCLGVGGGGVLGDGLRFKVIAPNVDTSSICCPGFLFSSSAVAGNNYRLRMKPKQKLRPSV